MVIGGRESPRLTVARELPMVEGGRELPRERGRKRDGCTEEGDKLLQAVKLTEKNKRGKSDHLRLCRRSLGNLNPASDFRTRKGVHCTSSSN